jgi:hypothetical protein
MVHHKHSLTSRERKNPSSGCFLQAHLNNFVAVSGGIVNPTKLFLLLSSITIARLLSITMAKKKNKVQEAGNTSDEAIPPSPAAPSSSIPKPKEAKTPQPSTSALIICRNKYVLPVGSECLCLVHHLHFLYCDRFVGAL